MKRTDIEIMAPVGCYESLHAAINAGANSVYFGIGRLNMRSASAANFSEADMEQIVEIAHSAGVKTYLTVNTIIYDDEMQAMHEVVDKAKAVGVDAVDARIVDVEFSVVVAEDERIGLRFSLYVEMQFHERIPFCDGFCFYFTTEG